MRIPGLTGRQQTTLLLMSLVVPVTLALSAGFIITSLQNLEAAAVEMPSSPATGEAAPSPTPLPTATATPAATPVPDEGIWAHVRGARVFNQVACQVETVRGLAPLREVALSFLDDAEMDALRRARYANQDVESALLPYRALELLPPVPPPFDRPTLSAVYVPEEEQIYIGMSGLMGDDNAQALLARAYVEALQYQHFGLEVMDARTPTLDERLAAQALIAGDAVLSTALYCHRNLASVDWDRITDLVVAAEPVRLRGDEADLEVWRRLQRFPTVEGRVFVQELFETGGWEAVNRAYTDLPRSTTQILHPSSYAEARGGPRLVTVPDLGDALGRAWHLTLEDTLGELVTGLYLSQGLPEDQSREAAAAWAGDTLVVWERVDGERLLVWRTTWASRGAAAVFEDSLTAVVKKKYSPAEPIRPEEGPTGQWWDSEGATFHTSRTGLSVLFLRAPDLSTAVAVAGTMP